jgi:GTPase
MLPLVAIVGKPNVGKSSLFNRIIDERVAIVSDIAGTTRDRIIREAEWGGFVFNLVDTGGIEILSKGADNSSLDNSIQREVDFAIEEADLIIFLVDARKGLTQIDETVAKRLLKSKKKILFVANKVDDDLIKFKKESYEYLSLGFGEPLFISSMHGINTGELLDLVVENLKGEFSEARENLIEEEDQVKIAMLGRPNAGKSTLFNQLSKTHQSIVSDTPGTTRDPIWSEMEIDDLKVKIWDTAGIRRHENKARDVEFYALRRAYKIVELVDIIILVVDSLEREIPKQDLNLLHYTARFGKGAIVFFNKWDKVDELKEQYSENIREFLKEELKEFFWVKTIYGSAKTGKSVNRIFDEIKLVKERRATTFTDQQLKDLTTTISGKRYPAKHGGKIYSIRQKFNNPPCFEVKVNNKAKFGKEFERFFKNLAYKTFDLAGTPVYIDYLE